MAAHIEPRVPVMNYGSNMDQSSYIEDDSPRTTAPSLTQFNAFNYSDPMLCITPEKPQKYSPKSKTMGAALRASQKVRFDSTVEVKHLSPPDTSTDLSNQSEICERSETSLSNVPWKDTLLSTSMSTTAEDIDQSYNQDQDTNTSRLTDTSIGTVRSDHSNSYSTVESDDVDLVDIVAADLKTREFDLIYGKKTTKRTKSSYVVRTSIWGEDGSGDNVLARPELNSTLLLRKELDCAKGHSLNIPKKVKQTLLEEEKTRAKVTEKATSHTNVAVPREYKDLVSVEIRNDDLLESAAKKVISKKPPPILKGKAKVEESIPAPDIMDFFTRDLQTELPSCSLEGIPKIEAVPKTAELEHAFDIYRHIRSWESW